MPSQNDFNFPSTPMCSLISKLTVFQGFFHFECLFISFEFFAKKFTVFSFPQLQVGWFVCDSVGWYYNSFKSLGSFRRSVFVSG